MKKKIILLCVIAFAVLGVAGCGSRGGETLASKDYVYRYVELPASREFRDGYSVAIAGDDIYMYGVVWDEFWTSSELLLIQLTEDGDVAGRASFPVPQGAWYGMMVGSSDGRLFVVRTEYPVYDGDFGGEIEVTPLYDDIIDDDSDSNGDYDVEYDDEAQGTDRNVRRSVSIDRPVYSDPVAPWQAEQYFLIELAMDGTERQKILLNENPELNSGEWFYINQLFAVPGNKLIVSTMDKYAIYDTNGNFQGMLDINITEGWGINFITLRDNRTMIFYYTESAMKLIEIDIATGRLGTEYVLEVGNVFSYTVHRGAGYDLYLSDFNDLYGYNLGQEPVRLMNFVDSDLNIYNINNIVAKEPGRFWGMIYDSLEGRNYFAQFTKVPPEEVADKIGLTLAGSFIDWEVKNRVVRFNKTNEKYRISIVDYSVFNTSDDWQAGVKRLNTDIATGRIPDILTITSDLPVESYVAKGLFADLLPYIDKDEELDVNDLMPNVVEAFSHNGKMFRLVPQFGVGTVMAKTSLVGNGPSWTIAEAEALQNRMPGSSLFDMMNRSSLMYHAMIYGGDKYINWEKGTCHFNDDAFIHLLEFMKQFPEEIDYNREDMIDYWANWESNFRTDRTLLMMTILNNLRDYNRIVKGQFGEPVTLIGFPSDTGHGAALITYQSFAMSARSKSRDGAWEFLRQYLLDDFQQTQTYMLPISRKAFDIKAKEAMEKPFYMDENGVRVEFDDVWWMDGREIIIPPMSQAELDFLTSYILSINRVGEYNQALVNIINEETAFFFEGQKTAREVVDIIQSRAQIYVNENR